MFLKRFETFGNEKKKSKKKYILLHFNMTFEKKFTIFDFGVFFGYSAPGGAGGAPMARYWGAK